MLKVDVITYQAMASQQSMLVLTRGDYVWLSYSRLRIILKMVKIRINLFFLLYIVNASKNVLWFNFMSNI